MVGSTPILMEIGIGLPAAFSYFRRNAHDALNEIHGYFAFALQAEAVDSNIGIAGFRIGAAAKPHGYIWAGVFQYW